MEGGGRRRERTVGGRNRWARTRLNEDQRDRPLPVAATSAQRLWHSPSPTTPAVVPVNVNHVQHVPRHRPRHRPPPPPHPLIPFRRPQHRPRRLQQRPCASSSCDRPLACSSQARLPIPVRPNQPIPQLRECGVTPWHKQSNRQALIRNLPSKRSPPNHAQSVFMTRPSSGDAFFVVCVAVTAIGEYRLCLFSVRSAPSIVFRPVLV